MFLTHFLFLFLFLFTSSICMATDLKPWFGNDYEAEIRVSVLYQNYHSIDTPDCHHQRHRSCGHHDNNCKRSEDDTFTTLSVSYPFKRYCGEFESTGAHTRHQSARIDNFRVTGRYQWLDDIVDPFSLVTSITLTEPLSRALHDISSFHHGHIEAEACISVGKKYGYACSKDFLFRWWNVAGIGIAEEGSVWYRGDAAMECKLGEAHLFRAFVDTLWGTGKKNLHPDHFKGYGSIRHQSVDLGIRYGYIFEGWGTLSLQYARRVYARNFPQNANLVLFEYYYPFGTQVSTNY